MSNSPLRRDDNFRCQGHTMAEIEAIMAETQRNIDEAALRRVVNASAGIGNDAAAAKMEAARRRAALGSAASIGDAAKHFSPAQLRAINTANYARPAPAAPTVAADVAFDALVSAGMETH